jgi:hypothetical protein
MGGLEGNKGNKHSVLTTLPLLAYRCSEYRGEVQVCTSRSLGLCSNWVLDDSGFDLFVPVPACLYGEFYANRWLFVLEPVSQTYV